MTGIGASGLDHGDLGAAPPPRPRGYENRLVGILALSAGIAALDAQAVFYLMPFVARDIHLTNGQIGLIGSAVLVGWAISGCVLAGISDRVGKRKPFLVGAFLCFALLSGLSALAAGFLTLLAARFLMGLAEGPVIPIEQAVVMAESSPARRGLNMGIVQNFGAQVIGTFLAPIVLVALAQTYGWRSGFVLAGVPGLIAAGLIWWFVAEPPAPARRPKTAGGGVWKDAINRNTLLCALIGICGVAWYFLILTFMPLYLTDARHLNDGTMGVIMGVMGVAGAVAAVVVPGISDRIGRKAAIGLFSVIGVLAPLGVILLPPSPLLLGGAMFVGCLASGTFPLFMGTVPQESVAIGQGATATALVIATAQIAGGVAGPSVGGFLADRFGLQAPLFLAAALVVLGGMVAMLLRETGKMAKGA